MSDKPISPLRTAEICLGEIHAAKGYPPPNFLIMLGNRYGLGPVDIRRVRQIDSRLTQGILADAGIGFEAGKLEACLDSPAAERRPMGTDCTSIARQAAGREQTIDCSLKGCCGLCALWTEANAIVAPIGHSDDA